MKMVYGLKMTVKLNEALSVIVSKMDTLQYFKWQKHSIKMQNCITFPIIFQTIVMPGIIPFLKNPKHGETLKVIAGISRLI